MQTVNVMLLNSYTSSSFVGRFDSVKKYVDMLVKCYDTLLPCTSICEENNRKVPGTDFTFSGTKVGKTVPMYVLHALNSILKVTLCLLLKI
jgi:hypothetical protein